jgi:hypothetical protein
MDAVQLVSLIQTIPIIGPYAVWLPVLVLICSALDAVLPQPPAGSIWVTPRKIVSTIGLAIFNARNAIPAGAPKAAAEVAGIAESIADRAKVPPMAALLIAGLLGLSACASVTPATVTTTIAAAQRDAKLAINLWGIAKGMAIVATTADPALAPILAGFVNAVDPVVSKAELALDAATTDAATLSALATTIKAQANALTAHAAPSITVIPTPKPT